MRAAPAQQKFNMPNLAMKFFCSFALCESFAVVFFYVFTNVAPKLLSFLAPLPKMLIFFRAEHVTAYINELP